VLVNERKTRLQYYLEDSFSMKTSSSYPFENVVHKDTKVDG
jgi:hypothetical protein